MGVGLGGGAGEGHLVRGDLSDEDALRAVFVEVPAPLQADTVVQQGTGAVKSRV